MPVLAVELQFAEPRVVEGFIQRNAVPWLVLQQAHNQIFGVFGHTLPLFIVDSVASFERALEDLLGVDSVEGEPSRKPESGCLYIM